MSLKPGHAGLPWNQRAQRIYTGILKEETLKLDADALIPEKTREETRDPIERLKRGKQPCQTWRRAKHGREIGIWLTTSVLLGESGNPAAIATTQKEI